MSDFKWGDPEEDLPSGEPWALDAASIIAILSFPALTSGTAFALMSVMPLTLGVISPLFLGIMALAGIPLLGAVSFFTRRNKKAYDALSDEEKLARRYLVLIERTKSYALPVQLLTYPSADVRKAAWRETIRCWEAITDEPIRPRRERIKRNVESLIEAGYINASHSVKTLAGIQHIAESDRKTKEWIKDNASLPATSRGLTRGALTLLKENEDRAIVDVKTRFEKATSGVNSFLKSSPQEFTDTITSSLEEAKKVFQERINTLITISSRGRKSSGLRKKIMTQLNDDCDAMEALGLKLAETLEASRPQPLKEALSSADAYLKANESLKVAAM